MNNRAIVLSANYGYINQATTTIKSVLYHNRDIHFYLINNDIPQEWFGYLNRRMRSLKSSITDCKINLEKFAQLTPTRNMLCYGRLLIPQLVKENRVIYLDSDTIVQDSLDPLFQLNLKAHPIAAAKDPDGWSFNSGVLVIDNYYWRQHQLVSKFLKFGKKHNLQNGDRSILNHFFLDDYLTLSPKYNYPIGSDSLAFYNPEIFPGFQEIIQNVTNPVIVHYSSKDKPRNQLSSGRMRNQWWQYANLNWYDLIMRNLLHNTKRKPITHFFTFTSSDQLINIEQLASALSDYDFDIAAWTTVSPTLIKHTHLPNVHVYPNVAGPLIDELIHQSGAYLDINEGPKEEQFMDRFVKADLPIITFNSVADKHYDNYHNVYQFNDQDSAICIATIHNLFKNN